MPERTRPTILAAIDVGTNAVRLEIARRLPDDSLETIHQERDPVRPGEGVFLTGSISPEVADRLLSTLRRYGALCRRYGATVRAVATAAVREARNGAEVVRRARKEAGLNLEVISGREEARLICLGVLHGRPPDARSLVIDIGGGSTEIAVAVGERAAELVSVRLGAVRLTDIFEAGDRVSSRQLKLMRSFAEEAFREGVPERPPRLRNALGSSGTIQAIVSYVAESGTRRITLRQLQRAVEEIAEMRLEERRRRFDPRRAEIIVAGAVILEAAMRHLSLATVTGVDSGLRNGLLLDLMRRSAPVQASAEEEALALGRRFGFDEPHARQVSRLSLELFDRLAALHRLPASARPLLEAAALLHDVGHAVSAQRHHKHTFYLIANADLPGFSDRERLLMALVARYHRRSAPDRSRADLKPLSLPEFKLVRRLAVLLRVADALDRSHRQLLGRMDVASGSRGVTLRLASKLPLDLEIWDAEREAPLFRKAFGRRLELAVGSAAKPSRRGRRGAQVTMRETTPARVPRRAPASTSSG